MDKDDLKEPSDDDIVSALLDTRKEVNREGLKNLVRSARKAGGTIVSGSYDPLDGDWCGTGVRFPWPPRPGGGGADPVWGFLQGVLARGGRFEVFPYGIIAPDSVLVNVRLKGMGA